MKKERVDIVVGICKCGALKGCKNRIHRFCSNCEYAGTEKCYYTRGQKGELTFETETIVRCELCPTELTVCPEHHPQGFSCVRHDNGKAERYWCFDGCPYVDRSNCTKYLRADEEAEKSQTNYIRPRINSKGKQVPGGSTFHIKVRQVKREQLCDSCQSIADEDPLIRRIDTMIRRYAAVEEKRMGASG